MVQIIVKTGGLLVWRCDGIKFVKTMAEFIWSHTFETHWNAQLVCCLITPHWFHHTQIKTHQDTPRCTQVHVESWNCGHCHRYCDFKKAGLRQFVLPFSAWRRFIYPASAAADRTQSLNPALTMRRRGNQTYKEEENIHTCGTQTCYTPLKSQDPW